MPGWLMAGEGVSTAEPIETGGSAAGVGAKWVSEPAAAEGCGTTRPEATALGGSTSCSGWLVGALRGSGIQGLFDGWVVFFLRKKGILFCFFSKVVQRVCCVWEVGSGSRCLSPFPTTFSAVPSESSAPLLAASRALRESAKRCRC